MRTKDDLIILLLWLCTWSLIRLLFFIFEKKKNEEMREKGRESFTDHTVHFLSSPIKTSQLFFISKKKRKKYI